MSAIHARVAAGLAALLTLGAGAAAAQTTGIVDSAPVPPQRAPSADAMHLSLEEALLLAVDANPSITTADLARLSAQVSENRARLNRYTLAVTGSMGLGVGAVKPWGEPAYTTSTTSWGAGASASIPLYSGGRVEGRIRQAELDVEISEVDHATAVRAIERAVMINYWTILSFELQLAASREALKINEEALAVTEARARFGLTAPIDVNQSRVNVYDLRDSILSLEAQKFSTTQDLIQLLNADGVEVVLTDEPAVDFRPWPTTADELLADAEAARPELLRFASEAQRADASVAIARSGALPDISVGATAQVGGEASSLSSDTVDLAFDGGDLAPDLSTSLGLNLSWVPFNLFQVRDAVTLAEISRQGVSARYQSQLRGIQNDVKVAHNALTALKSRTPYIDERLSLARDNLEIIQALYEQGNATILDLLQAQSAYQAATVQRASHQVNLIVAEYELRWAIGERLVSP